MLVVSGDNVVSHGDRIVLGNVVVTVVIVVVMMVLIVLVHSQKRSCRCQDALARLATACRDKFINRLVVIL